MQKLYEGNPFWTITSKPFEKFKPVSENLETDILIIGGGLSGNLCAHELAKRNYSVIVCEKERFGTGSSAVNTGILQYCSDIMLTTLIKSIGEEKAVLFYQMCRQAVSDLIELDQSLKNPSGIIPQDSIYAASSANDVEKLNKECKELVKHGFSAKFVEHDELLETYGVELLAAIVSDGDAGVNPYKFIQSLIAENITLGVSYFEKTEIEDVKSGKNGIVGITSDGLKVRAKKVIYATGYAEQYRELKKKADINRTYSLVTTIAKEPVWKKNFLFWETKRPYLYFRMTDDNRIIAGGMDEEKSKVEKNRSETNKINRKILKKIEKIMPGLDVKIEYEWNALFGESSDGLPFIGPSAKEKNTYYLLGFGGNGTVYAMAGSKIIADAISGVKNPYADIVKINRK
jgi:glycine/D-amino acid oxidase-like deaminating enzyme